MRAAGLPADGMDTELWMPLAEKAYAQWNETGKAGRDNQNSYLSLEGGWMQDVDPQVLGQSPWTCWEFADSDKPALVEGITTNKAVTIGTAPNPAQGLFGLHAYVVTGYPPQPAPSRSTTPGESLTPAR